MARVSIGLPVYNGENYLVSSLRSILDQTYSDFDLVISDNASTDRTEEICRDFASSDRRIRYHRQPRNLGLARNFNRVFELSNTEYFKWVSHDDLHARQFVERCVEVLDCDPSVVVATPRCVLIDGEGEEIRIVEDGGRHYWLQKSGKRSPIRPYDPARPLDSDRPHERFRGILMHTAWCIEIYGLMRSEKLRRTPLHLPFVGQDKRILAELSLMGKLAEIPEVLFAYRQHPLQGERYSSATQMQQVYVSGDPRRWSPIPRLSNLRSYLDAVRRSGLPAAERAQCAGVVGEWFFQVKKWPSLAKEAAGNLKDLMGAA